MQRKIRFAFLFALASFNCSSRDEAAPAAAKSAPIAESPAPVIAQPSPSPIARDDRRLTRAECTQGVDHAIALFEAEPAMADAAKMMRDGRTDFIAQCERTATVRDHECLLKSKTTHELGLCPMPGTR